MKINSILLKNFRKFENQKFDFSLKTAFKGKNSVGKTTVIESVFFLLTGKSFRVNNNKELIKNKEQFFYLDAEIEDKNNFKRKISSGYEKTGRKIIKIDDELVVRKEILSLISTIVSLPEDMNILNGGPSFRRNFADRAVFIDNFDYYQILVNYKRYIKHKQALIKNRDEKNLLLINKVAIKYIKSIRNLRKSVLEKIETNANKIFEQEKIDFKIEIKSEEYAENTLEKLNSYIKKEFDYQKVMYGPHLDKITIKPAKGTKNFISMGDIAFISRILKIAELEIYKQKDFFPVFICDDIFAFIDDERKKILTTILNKIENQVLITTIDKIDTFDVIKI